MKFKANFFALKEILITSKLCHSLRFQMLLSPFYGSKLVKDPINIEKDTTKKTKQIEK